MHNPLRPYPCRPRNILLVGLTILGTLGSVVSLQAADSVWSTKWLIPTPGVQSQPQIDLDDFDAMISRIRYGRESAQKILITYGNERIEKSDQAARLLGQRFAREKNPEKAKAWLEKAVQLEHNRDNLKALARFYLKTGDEDKWLKTMEAVLDLPFNVYWFAYENNEIANHFITTDEWEKALLYKNNTTRSQEDSYLEQAAWFNGALGHVEKGLEYANQNMAHYSPDFLAIYILAFDATPSAWSEELLDKGYKTLSKGDVVKQSSAAVICLSRDDAASAVTLLERALASSNNPWNGLFGALVCEDQGWNERRDKILKDAVARYPHLPNPSHNRKGIRRFLDLYIEANASGSLDSSQIEALKLFAKAYPTERFNVDAHAFAGELLRLKGETEWAKRIFSDIISIKFQNRIMEFMPYQGLRAMGEDPIQILNEQRKVRKQQAIKSQKQQVQK